MNLINEPFYNIESLVKTLPYFLDGTPNSKIVNHYDYPPIIEHYLNRLSQTDFDFPVADLTAPECYQRDILINNSHYILIWNIATVQQIIKQYAFPVTHVSVDEAYKWVDHSNILENRIRIDDTPIIIAHMPITFPDWFAIDGNHRIVAKHWSGSKTISAYSLPIQLHIKALASSSMQLILAINYNVLQINNFMIGALSEDEFNQSLIPV